MDGPIALTREVSVSLGACELTHLDRVPIDVDRARAQHALYIRTLSDAGYRVEQLSSSADMPDSVFVEDIAVVVPELAIITRPGAVSRRAEVAAVAQALERYRPLASLDEPATLDGGDVMVAGRRVFIGRSSRTNAAAIAQVRRLLAPFGYTVCEVAVSDCLHLKSAVTPVADDVLLVNPRWVAPETFHGYACVAVADGEDYGANALRLRDRVIVAAAFPRTAERLAARGLTVVAVDASELAKAEGAVTCCSLIVEAA
jgi:dimethylargininase